MTRFRPLCGLAAPGVQGEVVRFCSDKAALPAIVSCIQGLNDATLPAPWWSKDADLALLSGVFRHGSADLTWRTHSRPWATH